VAVAEYRSRKSLGKGEREEPRRLPSVSASSSAVHWVLLLSRDGGQPRQVSLRPLVTWSPEMSSQLMTSLRWNWESTQLNISSPLQMPNNFWE
jgi:hypothetical protein